jgi:hypothetical protein
MLLISPCAVVVCGPRWALPQSVFRFDIRPGCPTFSIFSGAGCPAVLPVVVVDFPIPAPSSGEAN